MPLPSFTSRQDLLDFLDSYASDRKKEIDRWHLEKGKGLIKSYILETAPSDDGGGVDVDRIARLAGWEVAPIEDGLAWKVDTPEGKPIGYLETISDRYVSLHSIEPVGWIDGRVERDVRRTAALDTIWLTGTFFDILWQVVVLPQLPERYIKLKFEYVAQYEDGKNYASEDSGADWLSAEIEERPESSLSIAERADRIGKFLGAMQDLHPPFKSIRMLRLPSFVGRGGYEFWSWGKVTHRGPHFRDGRAQIHSVTRLYGQVTREIERSIWVQAERSQLTDGTRSETLRGAPLTLKFEQPLTERVFRNFIDSTFGRGQGPFRLWGNPINLGAARVHVYGIDLHLWQPIHLDLTPHRFVVVLPEGTCGNTVHRLVANTQRYLDPGVRAFVGDRLYGDLIRSALLGKAESVG